jgi:redox-sensitive bicupin YhaK (pirin superfamily)
MRQLGGSPSAVTVLDDFRVSGHPFPPHPHAGFSAVTYVFEDSQGALRSRDSQGNDVTTGPGGIVWTQAGSGVIHEEIPAELNRQLHGLQVFVNLSSKNKLVTPRMFRLEKSEVPEWRSGAGDRVRVLVGAFEGVASPLVPAEPFAFLDVELRREVSFDLKNRENAIVYVVKGSVLVRAGARKQKVTEEHAVALYGGEGRITFESSAPAHFLILCGAEIRDPIVMDGPFIMNERSQIEDAVARYRSGRMGRLQPLSKS